MEAILFACGTPLAADKLAEAAGLSRSGTISALDKLARRYDESESGIRLLKLDNSYQLATRMEYSPFIKNALDLRRRSPLSPAAMEVLAIIAYNQPASKAFVEQVRGIDSSSVVNTLAEKGLVEEAGRLDLPGKPIAYRTTENFLRCFGINSLDMLPPLPGEEEQLSFDDNDVADGGIAGDVTVPPPPSGGNDVADNLSLPDDDGVISP